MSTIILFFRLRPADPTLPFILRLNGYFAGNSFSSFPDPFLWGRRPRRRNGNNTASPDYAGSRVCF